MKDIQALLRRLDSMDPAEWRTDATLSAFVDQQLTHVSSRVFEYEFPEIKYREMVPINTEIPSGAEVYEYHQEEQVGRAQATDDYADDSPAADAFLSAHTNRFVPLRVHYNYSVQDMRKALMGNVNLPERKARSARMAIERAIDYNMAFGDTDRGIRGLLNASGVTAANADSNGSGTTWAVKTPDQRNADILKAISLILDDTNGVEGMSVDVLLPHSQFFLLQSERLSDVGMSGLEYLRASVPQIRSVMPWHWLNGAGAGATDRMMVYTRDMDKCEGLLPLPLYSHSPEQRGMVWRTELESRAGGVVFYKPKSARYVDAI